jgi:hypothetical protein
VFASSVDSVTNTPPKRAFDGVTNIVEEGTKPPAPNVWVCKGAPTSAAPQFIGVEFEVPTIINSVALYGRLNFDRVYNPSDYTVETADECTDAATATWTVRATHSKADSTSRLIGRDGTYACVAGGYTTSWKPDPIVTSFAVPVVAKCVRLNITGSYYYRDACINTPTNTQIQEIEIQ